MTAKSKTRILVEGCGSIGRRHLQVLAQRDDVALAACDASDAALREACALAAGIEGFPDTRRALAWQPQLVVVATPNAAHRPCVEQAVRAGAHVLCEKPIADTVADGRAMVAAARRARRLLAVGYTERFRPSLEAVRKMAAEGELGTLIGGRAMVGTYNTLLCAKTDFRQKTYGALLVDYTHEFDYLRWIFGDVADVACMANNLGEKEKRCRPALAATLLRFRSGAVASVHMDYVQHPQRRTLDVFGDRRSVTLDFQADTLTLFDANEPGCRTLPLPAERNSLFRAEHQDMLEAMARNVPPRVTGEEGVKALAVAEAALAQIRGARGKR